MFIVWRGRVTVMFGRRGDGRLFLMMPVDRRSRLGVGLGSWLLREEKGELGVGLGSWLLREEEGGVIVDRPR